jgi:hypothetical protein
VRPSLYTSGPDGYVPEDCVRSVWDRRYQADLGPLALLAHEAQGVTGDGFCVVRLAFDVPEPVPAVPLTVRGTVLVADGRTRHVRLALRAGGRVVARSDVLAVREQCVALPPGGGLSGPADPVGGSWGDFPGGRRGEGPVEVRFQAGDGGPGPACVWARLGVDLLPDLPARPLVGLCAVVDLMNRVAGPLPVTDYTFVNPDAVLHLRRAPVGEWFRVDAVSTAGGNGVGLTSATVADRSGDLGMAVQTLIVRHRG